MAIYYLVYQLTNTVNGKIYIGCHMTKDMNDGYMGSGKRLAYAKKKYGEAAFKKEILSVHESADEMLAEERRLVNEEFLGRADVYNLTMGGTGSWFYVNLCYPAEKRSINGKATGLSNLKKFWKSLSLDEKMKIYAPWIDRGAKNLARGVKHTEETKKKMSETRLSRRLQSGKNNSQFNTRWIHSLELRQSKKISKEEAIPENWLPGRKMFTNPLLDR